MAPHDSQGLLLFASAFVIVIGFIIVAGPWAERPLRREIARLRAQANTAKTRIDTLNHELYRMQSIVENVKPHYERAQRLRVAIGEMKRVWLRADSTQTERERVLRENLWVLTPDYRNIRLSKPTKAGTLEGTALCMAGNGQTHDPVELRIALAGEAVTSAALAHAHAGVTQPRAGALADQRIEYLLVGSSRADEVGDLRLSWGAAGGIRIRPVTYAELIARAELLANPPLDPLEAQIISLAKAKATRAAA
jgi:hypothetical protein